MKEIVERAMKKHPKTSVRTERESLEAVAPSSVAQLMLDKIRRTMSSRDRLYLLGMYEKDHVELGGATIGGWKGGLC